MRYQEESIFDNIRSVNRRYEEIRYNEASPNYEILKKKAIRLVGASIAEKMTADEIINLIEGC